MPDRILVVVEQREGKLNRVSLETLAAAQAIGKETSWPVDVVLPGFHAGALAQELADQGILTQKEVAGHHLRHVLTRALGARGGNAAPDVQQLALMHGDCLLLCSDGLTEMVKDARIAEILQLGQTAEMACQSLVAEALKAGGKDNVTVVVGRYAFPETA